jgi:DNA-binding LacI/PurR family transcriptional regulator
VARGLGYKVNHSAANLRKGQTNAIGVVVTVGDEQPISDPFILSLIGHIADVLNAQGKNLLLTRVRNNHRAELEAFVNSGQVSGLMVIGQSTHHATLNALESAGVPMVAWGALLPETRYSVVGGDNLTGGYLATRHLLDGGAKRILFLGDSKFPEGKQRYLGYVKALKQVGMKPDKTLHRYCPLSAKEIELAINSALDDGVQFDAVFATSDVGAMSAIATLANKNIRVPKQVRVVGYDNTPLSAYFHPTLTTIDQPIGLAALAMVDLLNEKIAGGASRTVLLPATLIERKSSR